MILDFLKEDDEEYKINQSAIGMKYLFREFSIYAQKGAAFSEIKYINRN